MMRLMLKKTKRTTRQWLQSSVVRWLRCCLRCLCLRRRQEREPERGYTSGGRNLHYAHGRRKARSSTPPRPRPCPAVEKRPFRSSPSTPLVFNKPCSRNVGGGVGRTTSPTKPPSAAYMIAMLTMWYRYASGRRFVSGNGSGNAAASKGYSSMGYPAWRRSSVLRGLCRLMRMRVGQRGWR